MGLHSGVGVPKRPEGETLLSRNPKQLVRFALIVAIVREEEGLLYRLDAEYRQGGGGKHPWIPTSRSIRSREERIGTRDQEKRLAMELTLK